LRNNPKATAERIVDGWVKAAMSDGSMPMAASACSTALTTR
jgi:hypothetical protein